MRERWIFDHADTRRIDIDKKQSIFTAISLGLKEKEIGQIGGGHKPFLAADTIAALTGFGSGIDHFVGARFGLSNGVALAQASIH